MSVVESEAPFGVYVLTYPGDFHLSRVLVRSIREFNPGVPVMIIPGEGFERDDHPFDIPVMPEPGGACWPQIGHQDRKFWAFQGPFETFLYLDADTICTGSLDPLIRRIACQQGNFMLVQPWIDEQEWGAAMRDATHPRHDDYVRHLAGTMGRGPLARFDPQHDFAARYPFNAGVFASRRLAIGEDDVAALNRAERAFYRDFLGRDDWTWRSSALFFRDQGRLNYLAGKLAIPLLPLHPELICLAGASAARIAVADAGRGACDVHIVHWMGAKSPSPSLFCRGPLFRIYASLWSFVARRTDRWVAPGHARLPECVGYSVWRRHHESLAGPTSLHVRLAWSWTDLKRTLRLAVRCLKLTGRRVARSRPALRVPPAAPPAWGPLVPPKSSG